MRAAVVTNPGTPPICTEFPEPDGVPMTLVAAGVHNVVRGIAAGRHYASPDAYPLVPGIDAVARTADGRLVYTGFAQAPWGTMAERMVTPFGIPLPAGADPLAVAAGVNPGLSGWMPLVARRDETGGLDTVLVLGATGMSGTMAVQAAYALGAKHVIAAGRDPEALGRLAARGAQTVSIADPGPGTLAEVVTEAAPTLVLDFLWGPIAETALTALGQARVEDCAYVQIGSLAGENAAVPASPLRSRRIRISGSGRGSVSKEEMLGALPAFLDSLAAGELSAPYEAYTLSEVGSAWAHQGRSRAVVVPG
ncbi:zinc-binding alcohol dehydrogenase family protein [Catenuloplanes japonicus]|uniref:zinc-binding alcohol dehydrogenase family protein n=1 Tax=Catenuloplanes japonicus TaxID=33876 RepID=UPI00052536DA|nr:zinc-binding alcohol dehydrogenase family protein [Catenuloplanes japonicus]